MFKDTYTNPDRKNYSITLGRKFCSGNDATVHPYTKKKAGKTKPSNKLARVENYNEKSCGNLKLWMKRQELGVSIFYWLNYDRKLTFQELCRKIFFCKNDTTVCSIQQLKNAGCSLSSLIDNKNIKLSMDSVVTIFKKLLEKVRKLHEAGYVHHDLSPNNILVQFGTSLNDIKAVNLIDGKYNKINQNVRTGSVNDYVQSSYSISRKNTASKFDGTADIFACNLIFMELLAKVLSYNSQTNNFLQERYDLCLDFRKSNLDLSNYKLDKIDNNLKKFLENGLKSQVKKSKIVSVQRIFPLIRENLIGKNKTYYDISTYLRKLEIVN